MEAWLLLGLTVALAYAFNPLTTRYVLKSGQSAIAMSAITNLLSFLIIICFFIATQIQFVFSQDLLLFGLVIGILTSAASLLWAYVTKTKEASYVSPLLQTDSLFALVLAIIVLSEPLQPVNILGVLIIFFGGFVINSKKGLPHISKPLIILLASAFIESLNKLAVKISTVGIAPILLTLVSSMFRVLIYGGMGLVWRREKVRELAKSMHNKRILAGVVGKSICTATAVIGLFYALSLGMMAKVVAIANVAPLFAVMLGFLILKEKETAKRLVGAAAIILGAYLVYL